MNMYVPPELGDLMLVVTGMPFPEANTDSMTTAGQATADAADQINHVLIPQINTAINRIQQGFNSDASQEFVNSMAAYTTAQPQYFVSAASQLETLSGFAYDTAAQVDYMKLMCVLILVELLVELVVTQILSFFDFGMSEEWLAAEYAAARFLLRTVIGRVILRILTAELVSIATQVALDAIVQRVLIDEGIQQSWNWADTVQQLEVGALGGIMGVVLEPLAHELEHLIAPVLGETLAHVTTHLVEGGVHNAGHETLFNAMQGYGWGWTWTTFAGGAFAGGAHMAGGYVGAKIDGALPDVGITIGPTSLPVETVLKSYTGEITPGVLNDIATAPTGPLADSDEQVDTGVTAGPAEDGVKPPAVPLAVQVLNRYAVPVGPDTAYNIALKTGFVPTVGDPAEHADYSDLTIFRDGGQPPRYLPPDPSEPPAETLPPLASKPDPTPAIQQATPTSNDSLETTEPVTPESQAPPGQVPEGQVPVTPESQVPVGGSVTPQSTAPLGLGHDEVPVQPVRQLPHETVDVPLPQTKPPADPTSPATSQQVQADLPQRQANPLDQPNPEELSAPERQQGLDVLPPVVEDGSASGVPKADVTPLPDLADDPAGKSPFGSEPETLAQAQEMGLDPERIGLGSMEARSQDPDLPSYEDMVPELHDIAAARQELLGPPRGPGEQPAPSPSAEERSVAAPLTEPNEREAKPPGLAGPVDAAQNRGEPRPVSKPDDEATEKDGPARGLRPGGLGDAGGAQVQAAGTRWARDGDGWYVAKHAGVLERGPSGGELRPPVEVPAGSKAVLDGSGELRHVLLPGGVSYERGLDGVWSGPRERPAELVVVKIGEPVQLRAGDGRPVLVLGPENEVVRDQTTGQPVAYRQVKSEDGSRLPEPRTFLPDGEGGWAETGSPVNGATYEAWLASANQAHEAARTLYDIARRSSPTVPERARLVNLSDTWLRVLLHGSADDAAAAIYEAVRRSKGVALRWTQMSAAHAFAEGKIVNMAAGEGKSWLFLVDAARQAVLPRVDAVQVVTTRGNLADREFKTYKNLLTPLGFDVHRMNSDSPSPEPVEKRPTIYVGTSQDVGFTYLKSETVPGQKSSGQTVIHASVDEIDEAFVYSNTSYILSKGVQGAAPEHVATQVGRARDFLAGHLDSGQLTEADFGRTPDQVGGSAALTSDGLTKAGQLLGKTLTAADVTRLNMAATAHFEYVEDVHYIVYGGKVFIIDQTTHEVLYNPETATESRWNGGLAQAVEAKHGLTIRADPATSNQVTAQQLYAKDAYKQVTGASGTVLGKGDLFAKQGLSPHIEDIPRYYSSRLLSDGDRVSPDLGAKLDAIAKDVRDMQASDRNQPQLILAHRNDLVAKISEKLGEDVSHTAIDARWFLEKGANREEEFKKVIEQAGQPGHVLVINMQGARGVDIPISDEAKALGGLHVRVTARSGTSEDIDIQAQNRAARSGDPGSVSYYISPDDEAFKLSRNPDVQHAIIQYDQALHADDSNPTPETHDALSQAEQGLRDLIPSVQTEAAGRLGMHTPTHLPNAPPTTFTSASAATTPAAPAQPPPDPTLTRPGPFQVAIDHAAQTATVPGDPRTWTVSPALGGGYQLIHPTSGTSWVYGEDGTRTSFHLLSEKFGVQAEFSGSVGSSGTGTVFDASGQTVLNGRVVHLADGSFRIVDAKTGAYWQFSEHGQPVASTDPRARELAPELAVSPSPAPGQVPAWRQVLETDQLPSPGPGLVLVKVPSGLVLRRDLAGDLDDAAAQVPAHQDFARLVVDPSAMSAGQAAGYVSGLSPEQRRVVLLDVHSLSDGGVRDPELRFDGPGPMRKT